MRKKADKKLTLVRYTVYLMIISTVNHIKKGMYMTLPIAHKCPKCSQVVDLCGIKPGETYQYICAFCGHQAPVSVPAPVKVEIPSSILEIAKNLKASSTRGTSDAVYEVQRLESIYCRDDEATHFTLAHQGEYPDFEIGDTDAVEDHLAEYYDDPEITSHVLSALDDGEFGDIGKGFEVIPCKKEWRGFHKFFFSEKSAEKFASYFTYKYGKMRTYAISAYDLDEVRAVREFLLELAQCP
jgi:predicted RNA-binding Zn-ribbon protein involved in translation (DUF1610 family)